MKTLLKLFLILVCQNGYALPPSSNIEAVLINGKPVDLSNNKLKIYNSDHLFLILSPLPGGHYYSLKSGSGKISFFPDSTHILIDSLKKGSFNFSIQMQSNSSRLKSEKFEIQVHNHFFRSWWFIPVVSLYLLLLLGASLFAINLFNFRNKEKLHHLRGEWTNQLHHDIGGDLSSVSKRLEILKLKLTGIDEKMFENLNKTFLLLIDIQKKLRFVFNLVDPQKDTLQAMFLGIHDFAEDNCSFQGINLHYTNQLDQIDNYKIDVARINKIYLVLKEGLNNAFKHAKAQNISLHIEEKKEGIGVSLQDDGIGFDPNVNYAGTGLKKLHQDAKDGFMDIKLSSFTGKGTTINIIIHTSQIRSKKPPTLGV